MPPSRVVVDGLWRCLCPSFDAIALTRSAESPLNSARRIGRDNTRRRTVPRWPCQATQARPIHTQTESACAAVKEQLAGLPVPAPVPAAVVSTLDLIQAQGRYAALATATTPVIYETLRELRHRQGQRAKIRHFVQYLIDDRGERPNIFLYEALVTANWDITGSADELAFILREMANAEMEPSKSIYHSALRLLAVHPDYMLRNKILGDMKKKKMYLKPNGMISVALGLLRDGQYEMALDYLDWTLKVAAADIPHWVFDTFIFTLGKLGFVEEAVEVLQKRPPMAPGSGSGPGSSSLGVWYFLLDECSRALRHTGTKYIWDKMVEPGILNPSDGIAVNVLNTAARNADADLANRAIQHLSARRVKLGLHHFEPLVDCYAQSVDLENALQVLCIMSSAGTQPDSASTRSIFALLKQSPRLAENATDLLSNLRKTHEIPIAALNVLLEALCEHGPIEAALGLYREARHLCPLGPNYKTFQLLMAKSENAEVASFLVSEMEFLSIRPQRDMYDHLVRSFALDGSLEVAFGYLSLMESAGGYTWLSKRTLLVLLERCFRDEDPRVWGIVDKATTEREMDIRFELAKLMDEIPKERKAHAGLPQQQQQAGSEVVPMPPVVEKAKVSQLYN
ncbi:hypothetical protein B0H63DRAFT_125371 [Podospora didyma]|uniref:Pentatricopeptide repeat-containing protein-mitochondrial domain-containing protein n=1 Tax=Podospora didyma TaxID=330526 RepID=A0AAE0U573_9PEZI|nr:hypothetical protein B0H63DRAFT_125371 [Podospora didyma]